MPVVPASRVTALSGEGAFEVLRAARHLEDAGRHVVHLEIGEPDWATPPHVVEAAVRALHDGNTRYVNPAGLPALRDAIASSLAWRGVRAPSENIVVVPGAKPMLFYALLAVLEPGDEVLVPDPGFPIYPSVVRFAGAVPVPYSLDASGAVDSERLAALIGPRTRALVVNLPGNPTGGIATAEDLRAIAELALRHDLVVISDEVYGRIRYDRRADSIAALAGMPERTIIVDSFSKAYAMTGWRLGYLIAPREFMRPLQTAHGNFFISTNEFVQWAALAALREASEDAERFRRIFDERRHAMVAGLRRIGLGVVVPPTGAFYVLANAQRFGADSKALAFDILEHAHVGVTPGVDFGRRAEGFLRFSYANSLERIEEAIERIGRYFAEREG